MTAPVVAKFGNFIVSIAMDDSPNDFRAPCGFKAKSLNLGKNLADSLVPDCDPEVVGWISRGAQSRTASITGEGVLAASSIPDWIQFYESDDSFQCEVEITFTSGVLTFLGYFHLESWEMGTQLEGDPVVTSNISLQSDGEMTSTWVPTP